jgi:hypothetical protein
LRKNAIFSRKIDENRRKLRSDHNIDPWSQVAKVCARATGRVVAGAVLIAAGGVFMVYDIYRLTQEIKTLVGGGSAGANAIR